MTLVLVDLVRSIRNAVAYRRSLIMVKKTVWRHNPPRRTNPGYTPNAADAAEGEIQLPKGGTGEVRCRTKDEQFEQDIISNKGMPNWREWDYTKDFYLDREQVLSKIVDELIVMLSSGQKRVANYEIVDRGLALIAEVYKEKKNLPITVRIHEELKRRGWL